MMRRDAQLPTGGNYCPCNPRESLLYQSARGHGDDLDVAGLSSEVECTPILKPEVGSVADPGISVNLNVPECNMLFPGMVGERKGVPELLQALAMPDFGCRSWHLTIAGNGDLEQYQALIEDAGLEKRIHLEGLVDKPRVREILLSSQIFVLPSRAEKQPLSVLEEMSCGLASFIFILRTAELAVAP